MKAASCGVWNGMKFKCLECFFFFFFLQQLYQPTKNKNATYISMTEKQERITKHKT